MSKVKTYAVNCNDAWLNTDGDDISGSYVKYADYMALATKLDLAERACAAVVAENAAFKDINAWCKTDAFSNMYREFKTAEAVGCCNADCMHDAMVVAIMHAPEAPATDAFLAEVERKAIRKFINSIEHILRDKLSPYDTEEIYDLALLALNLSNIANLKRYELDMDGCDSCGQDCGADMSEDPEVNLSCSTMLSRWFSSTRPTRNSKAWLKVNSYPFILIISALYVAHALVEACL